MNQSKDKWHYHYQPAMSYLDQFHTDEGLAIFSKYPIVDIDYLVLSRDLYDSEDAHQRIVLKALLDTPVGQIHVFNTHFALTSVARQRAVVELWNWVQQFPKPQILMGDLNAEPNDTSIEFLVGKVEIDGVKADFVDVTVLSGKVDDLLSFPAWEPIKRIDFMLVRGIKSAKDVKLLGKTPVEKEELSNEENTQLWSSDHFGVSCTLEL